MSQFDGAQTQFGFPKPGRALIGALLTLFLLWLMFALAINWGDASPRLFELFCGNTDAILRGELWRLFTAPLMHAHLGVGHIVWTLFGFYFLTPSLEQKWGGPRLLRFFAASAVIAYGFQFLALLVLPASVGYKLAGEHWFGAFPVVEAVAIAWALSFKGQTVRMFFVLPMTSTGLVWMVIGFSVLRVIGGAVPPEGLLSPFGGMFAGWLLGGGNPSPLRRWYLKLKLKQLDREADRVQNSRRDRVKDSPFQVIEGGKSRGSGKPTGKPGKRGPDGGWLN
ncbi:MAG: hypothetical protein RJA70_3584 [Pseudomonadota bacterium]|jgi:membrane associated rhomboid family serine protease